ncbi:hypothetical protein RRU01S_03_03280 [Agrobacterium rubi TR3 = NBRC 13261]|uniref:DUF2938 domain-containing protein n=1 Tax=Agrobacterium rubi TR3 = NBRC 13261 TaxID=1368415 RepID=A0A081CR59_9HYPH|nr:DUF2938 domain-containing protein [Agrobacterium rubi]MBP1877039.1 hypothetical protein [Agrobacterium rubi]MCL6651223.1 hypothetical protein [Agrobacterium rubi]GAK69155.1 hypothetical protein RRU01S_03_03280 [Agrobacterium rubi TR3 = NBRC 13261]
MVWEIVWRGVAMGIGGTMFMDIWAIILHRFFHQPAPNWGPVGRWFWHLPKGTVFHDNIARAAHYEHEVALGWISHYAVGIIYGVLLAVIVPSGWFAAPTFLLPWIVGIITVGAGWFLLQPGLGIGWAASKTPNPNKVRALNLIAHTIFALGMFVAALIIH